MFQKVIESIISACKAFPIMLGAIERLYPNSR
jgi:hypothetical protein